MSDAAAPRPVEIRGLSKTYTLGFFFNRRVKALQGLDLTIEAGQVYGLVGPNGAGKSTTIKILMNLVKASGGDAKLFGRPVHDANVRRLVGFLPENPAPYAYLTGREFLVFAGRLAGLSGEELDRRVGEVLGQVEMVQAQKLQSRRYSKGMVQRIALAQALIARPKLLILDEPTSGLDPVGRRLMRDIILAQRDAGATVLLCSHIIPDVEALSQRIAVLVGGRRVREGTVSDLLGGHDATMMELVVEGVSEAQLLECGLKREALQRIDERWLVKTPEGSGQALLKSVMAAGGRVSRFQPTRFGLEDLFLETVKEAGSRTVGGDIDT